MSSILVEQIRNARSLPALPATAVEVLRLTQSDNASATQLAAAIENDPSLAAKLLRMVNSSLFGLNHTVVSIKQAVAMIGQRAVRVTALSVALTEQINSNKNDDFDYETYWRTSLTIAVAARMLCLESRPSLAEEAFIAGLLSQIGRLAAHQVAPELYQQALEHKEKEGVRLLDAERSVLGVTGATLGREMLCQWNLPQTICAAVGASRGEGLMDLKGEERDIAMVVHGATLIADLFCNQTSPAALDQVKAIVKRCTGVDDEALEDTFNQLGQAVLEAADSLTLGIGRTTDYNDLREGAAAELAWLTVQAQMEHTTALNRAVAAESRAKQLDEEKQDIQKIASTDSLTQIANRAAFDSRLKKEIDALATGDQLLGMLMLDVDHFKQFNDTYGHQAGDEVLRSVAQAIADAVRGAGFVARFGGEEFVVLMRIQSESDAIGMGEKIRLAIESHRVVWNNDSLAVTASVGAATTNDGTNCDCGENLVALADERLYQAKEGGRNRIMPTAA